MNCPRCGGPSSVRETRKTDYGIRRRRFCEQRPCAARFTTAEVIIPENVRLDSHGRYHLVAVRDLESIVLLVEEIKRLPDDLSSKSPELEEATEPETLP